MTIFLIILQGMQIHMKSDRGEIEVFLCPEEEALSHFGTSASVLTSEESATEDNDSDAAALPSPTGSDGALGPCRETTATHVCMRGAQTSM